MGQPSLSEGVVAFTAGVLVVLGGALIAVGRG
jgi:hypothetical protein